MIAPPAVVAPDNGTVPKVVAPVGYCRVIWLACRPGSPVNVKSKRALLMAAPPAGLLAVPVIFRT